MLVCFFASHDCAQKDKNIPKDFQILFEGILENSKKVLKHFGLLLRGGYKGRKLRRARTDEYFFFDFHFSITSN